MIQHFIESIEKIIASNPVVLSSSIQKHFSPDGKTLYLKGTVLFIESSILEIFLFIAEADNSIVINKYRLHYMDKQGEMVFRYDNAPHHRDVSSFPHHKHTLHGIMPSNFPSFKDILNEIAVVIIRN